MRHDHTLLQKSLNNNGSAKLYCGTNLVSVRNSLVGRRTLLGAPIEASAALSSSRIKRHFPPATQEWNNSVYAYNSKRTILLSAIDKIVIKLIKSYFNAYFLGSSSMSTKVSTNKISRKLSVLNKVYVSKPEIKHTNSKVIITIYKYGSSIKTNKNNKIKINDWQNKHINNTTLIHSTPLWREGVRNNNLDNKNILDNNNNIYYFSDLISKFYAPSQGGAQASRPLMCGVPLPSSYPLGNQYPESRSKSRSLPATQVVFRIIDLKYLHLNTSILVEYLSNKLTNRKKILRKYRFLLRKIKLPVYSKHNKNILYNNTLKELSLLNNISNLSVENLKKNKLVNKHLLTNMGLSSIKYKAVVGARFEIGGRLTRRNIASKSVFKFGQVGTLKNIDASYKGMPVVTLRGNHRPNLDFSSYKTRTRNGAFNVKG